MNRSSKRLPSREEARPRRQCYQPLRSDDFEERLPNDVTEDASENTFKLYATQPEQFVEKTVEPGDTLLSISLQFNCPVAELKRVNNIIRDNEIFARRIIKVPIKPGSVVAEKLAPVHLNGVNRSEPGPSNPPVTSVNATIENSNITDTLAIAPYLEKVSLAHHDNNILKQSITAGIPSVLSEKLVDIDSIGEESVSSPLLQNSTLEAVDEEDQVLKCSGADWGLSWLQVVICALLLGCAVPILYGLLYIAEKEHSN